METNALLPQTGDNVLDRPVYDAAGLQHTSPSYLPIPASSPECLEAKRLLDLTAYACRETPSEPPFTAPLDVNMNTAVEGFCTPDTVHHTETSASHGHWSMAEPVPRKVPPAMGRCNGSFSDALALLLRSRSSKTGVPPSPTEVGDGGTHRYGLSVSTLAVAMTPSSEPSQDKAGDDSFCNATDTELHTASQPQLQGECSAGQRLPEDPNRSVNAGVAWQFGDRIIPADLLRECVLAPYCASI